MIDNGAGGGRRARLIACRVRRYRINDVVGAKPERVDRRIRGVIAKLGRSDRQGDGMVAKPCRIGRWNDHMVAAKRGYIGGRLNCRRSLTDLWCVRLPAKP